MPTKELSTPKHLDVCDEVIEVEELKLMVVTTDRHSKTQSKKEQALVLWFEDVGIGDVSDVGGKNASLGEMIQQLTPKAIVLNVK